MIDRTLLERHHFFEVFGRALIDGGFNGAG
jgi:hypothetical protein